MRSLTRQGICWHFNLGIPNLQNCAELWYACHSYSNRLRHARKWVISEFEKSVPRPQLMVEGEDVSPGCAALKNFTLVRCCPANQSVLPGCPLLQLAITVYVSLTFMVPEAAQRVVKEILAW